jgi:hypothetical protein
MTRLLMLPLGLLLCAAPAAAQTLEGRAVEHETRRPVSAAFVVMLDSAGKLVAAACTDSAPAEFPPLIDPNCGVIVLWTHPEGGTR